MKALVFAAPLALSLAACAMSPPPPKGGDASVAGEIRTGSQATPALRVCALAIGAGDGRCIEVPAGASSYRIDRLGAGRYYVTGWSNGDIRLVAHAETVRCVTAPCPPDNLTAVELGTGESKTGIDLAAVYAPGQVPAGWPSEPPPQ